MQNTHKIALYSMLIAVAMVLSWVESQIPFSLPVPGMKLGLTNIVVLIALYKLGNKDALILNIVRVILVGITFTNTFSMVYSLSGAIISFIIMVLFKKFNFHQIIVSIAGGIGHNVGQIMIAMIFLSTKIIGYLPFLWISGIISGAIIGMLSGLILKRIPTL